MFEKANSVGPNRADFLGIFFRFEETIPEGSEDSPRIRDQ